MSESARDWLTRGVAAAKAKELREARAYLKRALENNPDPRQRVDAYYWLSEVAEDPAEKRSYLEDALVYEPTHYLARRNLAILDGRIDPAQVVDPNAPLPPASPQEAAPARQHFVCPQCGGRMAYTPQSSTLKCRFCGAEQTVAEAHHRGLVVREEDFILALATAKGHTRVAPTPAFECGACGGVYALAPETLSLTCPYCASVYVLLHLETRNAVPPEGVVPFSVTESEVAAALRQWARSRPIPEGTPFSAPRGLYLPVWTFDLAGEVPWSGWKFEAGERVPESGTALSVHNDLLVAASHRLPAPLLAALDAFDPSGMIAYEPAFLAEWPAELYQIPPADAAMAARWKALALAKQELDARLRGQVSELRLGTARLLIEAYRLVLLPVWISTYDLHRSRYTAIVHGRTGEVSGQAPPAGGAGFLARLFGSRP